MFLLKMLLAHLVGDYVAQGDRIATWKERSVAGVMVHGLIVAIVTVLLALPFGGNREQIYAAMAIGGIHTVIDLLNFMVKRRLRPQDGIGKLLFFFCDQLAHLCSIIAVTALITTLPTPFELLALLQSNHLLTLALTYTFISMPAWVLIEYMLGGLKRTGPDFAKATKRKYMTIFERGLIMTFVLFGQVFLVPLIAVPRLMHDRAKVLEIGRSTYFGELAISVILTLIIGFSVQQLL